MASVQLVEIQSLILQYLGIYYMKAFWFCGKQTSIDYNAGDNSEDKRSHGAVQRGGKMPKTGESQEGVQEEGKLLLNLIGEWELGKE